MSSATSRTRSTVRRLLTVVGAMLVLAMTTGATPVTTATLTPAPRLAVEQVNPTDLANQIYRDLLGRPADATGREYWAGAIASGTDPVDIIEAFINSPEVGGAYEPVIRLYRASFLRPPDHGGLSYWVKSLRSGIGLEDVAEVFATNAEFVNRYGSLNRAEFVDRIYRNVLHRAPDSEGLNYWTRQLGRGVSRGEMLTAFANSTENVRRTSVSSRMSLLSITLLRTIPGGDDMARWDKRPATVATAKLIGEVLASPRYQIRLAGLFPSQHPLTGQYGALPINRPALAVKTDNVDQARPHVGLNLADVVYEEMVEGKLTRLIAVYHSQTPAVVGPVRSIRISDFDVLAAYNYPLLAASGANPGVLRVLRSAPVVNVNALVVNDYWRDSNRRAPHNLMTSPTKLWTHAPANVGPPPVMFATGPQQSKGVAAPKGAAIDFGNASISWTWSAADQMWRRAQNGTSHVDSNRRPIGAENVVVMVVQYTANAIDAESPEAHTVGRGSAVVFINGDRVDGFWQRNSATEPIELVDSAGQLIVMRPGQTWVELAPPESVTLR